MASAPKQKPLIKIPGIGSAKKIDMFTRGQGESLVFQMFVGRKQINFDQDDPDGWMDRSWFGLVVRELDRLKVWHYRTVGEPGQVQFIWSR